MSKGRSGRDDRTQTERAYDALKAAIIRGQIAEGAFLQETVLTCQFGIGRTPFREACNRLHYEGLLEAVPRRGYLVPEMSFHDVRDLFEARQLLEGAIAELAALRATDEEIGRLEQLARRPASGPKARVEDLIEGNREFHMCLARMTRNRELARALQRLLERTQRFMYVEMAYGAFDSAGFRTVHEPIFEALRKRDAPAARAAVLEDLGQAQGVTFGNLSFDTGGRRRPPIAHSG